MSNLFEQFRQQTEATAALNTSANKIVASIIYAVTSLKDEVKKAMDDELVTVNLYASDGVIKSFSDIFNSHIANKKLPVVITNDVNSIRRVTIDVDTDFMIKQYELQIYHITNRLKIPIITSIMHNGKALSFDLELKIDANKHSDYDIDTICERISSNIDFCATALYDKIKIALISIEQITELQKALQK